MSRLRQLKGRRVAVLAADGFEKVELVTPLRILQFAGAKTDVISLRRGRIRGVNLHMPATRIGVDKTVGEADPADYCGLLLPGGFINPDLLRQSAQARQFVHAFAKVNKPIATLCHGPWLLASAGVIGGRTVTAWPGIRDDLVNAGAVWRNESLVEDGNLITSRGPQDLVAFVPAMLRAFASPVTKPVTATSDDRSDAQPTAPLGWAVAALRFVPKPSAVAAVAAGAAGVVSAITAMRRPAHPNTAMSAVRPVVATLSSAKVDGY